MDVFKGSSGATGNWTENTDHAACGADAGALNDQRHALEKVGHYAQTGSASGARAATVSVSATQSNSFGLLTAIRATKIFKLFE